MSTVTFKPDTIKCDASGCTAHAPQGIDGERQETPDGWVWAKVSFYGGQITIYHFCSPSCLFMGNRQLCESKQASMIEFWSANDDQNLAYYAISDTFPTPLALKGKVFRVTRLPCEYCGKPLNEAWLAHRDQEIASDCFGLLLHRACIHAIEAMSADQLYLSLTTTTWHFMFQSDISLERQEKWRNDEIDTVLHFHRWMIKHHGTT